jgi:hypothetical protein
LVARSAKLVEKEIKDPKTGLLGTPDWVQQDGGTTRLLDFKTGLRQSTPTDEQRRQLLLYAHLVRVKIGKLPDVCAVVDGAGVEHPVDVNEVDVNETLSFAVAAVADYNRHAANNALDELAKPSDTACRWCPFRPVCLRYFEARQPDWMGSKGDLHGEVTEVDTAAERLTIEASYPAGLSGSRIRVTGVSQASDIRPGLACSIVDTDLLGGPTSQCMRWDSRFVAF